MIFHENIRMIRREKGMTQETLAEAMGITTAAVSKWETGQSAPDVEMLMALADFFEVSVDTLLGHELKADRKKAMLEEMENLALTQRFDEAKVLAQKLLRNYPNDYEVVSQISDLYYRSDVTVNGSSDMEYSIELTKRLFALLDDPTGIERFELLSRLGNQYELLKNYEMARKYYTESNVFCANNRSLARILADEGKYREAADAITEEFSVELFNIMLNSMSLHKVWRELGEVEKAEAVLDWAIGAVKTAGKRLAENYNPMLVVLYTQKMGLAKQMGDESKARVCADSALALVEKREENKSVDFLTENLKKLLISGNLNTPEYIRQLLEESATEHAFVLTSTRTK